MIKMYDSQGNYPKKVVFADVAIDQFFINQVGLLCQKTNVTDYSVIAGRNGIPFSSVHRDCSADLVIMKVLDHISRIEFD